MRRGVLFHAPHRGATRAREVRVLSKLLARWTATRDYGRHRVSETLYKAELGETASDIKARRLKPRRIVIVGEGFAGVAAARALLRCNAEVILIDRRNHHIFQPLLYQVATAILAPSEIAAPIRQLARRQRNLLVMLAEVTGVDLKSRSVDAYCPDGGRRKRRQSCASDHRDVSRADQDVSRYTGDLR